MTDDRRPRPGPPSAGDDAPAPASERSGSGSPATDGTPGARDERNDGHRSSVVGQHRDLPRRLGVFSAAAVLVGSTIGSGIFRVPSTVVADAHSLSVIALVWVVGGVVALFGALTLAELAALFPRSGGIYVYLREAYGPLPAFLFGWTELLIIRPSALGAIAMIFAAYLGQFLSLDQTGIRVAAGIAIVAVGLANIRSVLWGAAIENTTTAAKVVALAGLAVAAFFLGNGHAGALATPGTSLGAVSWGAVGVTLIAVLWAYDGWADLTFMAGEVRDPGRTLPRALIGGTVIVVAVYVLVNAAYLFVLPLDAVARSSLVAADAATAVIGRAGAAVVAALVMLSTFGSLNGSMMTGPRIFWAMADDDLFFRPIAAVHKRFATPWVAITLATGLGIAYVSFNTFEQLADAFILGIWPFYALGVLAVIRLRRKLPDAERPYRTPGYPLVPLVFLLASLGLLGNALIQEPVATGIGFAVILVGIPVFLVWQRLRA